MAWVERELQVLGQNGSVPQQDRVRVFREAFGRAVELLPDYRPLFFSYQQEMDEFGNKLQEQLREFTTAEGRIKTVKMESIAFVGESTLRFQEKVRDLRKNLENAESTRDKLSSEKDTLQIRCSEMETRSKKDRYQSDESHKQNLDILSNLERMEKQVEALRKQDRETNAELAKLQHQVKDQEQRNKMVEAQLNAERVKNANLAPREEFEAAKEEIRAAKAKCLEWEERYAAKEKDYQNIVEAYKNVSGHDTGGVEARPLTPRPFWSHCRGVLDPDALRTMQQSELLQDLVVRVLSTARQLLAAYGLHSAAQKSLVFAKFAKHPTTVPLVSEAALSVGDRQKTPQQGNPDEGGKDEQGLRRRNSFTQATSPPMSQGDRSGEAFKEEEKWLPGDMDHSTPVPLRHAEKIRNQRFSRKKTRDFLERVLQHRVRGGDKLLCRPFVETMMEVLHQELGEEEVTAFAVNIFASVRKYAAEPDFLGFLLLITGQVADVVVRDNRSLCAELLRIFRIYFEVADGSTRVTRQKFFSALRDALPQKEKDQCQELAAYFPASGPMTPVNYEWLLVDDPYVLSPIVYALRLQHLEEGLGLSDRMERQVKSCARDGPVTYEKIEAVCKDDAQLSILQPEDFARAFRVQLEDLGPGTEQNVSVVLELLKNGGIFHELFYPALPEDDGEDGESVEDEPAGDAET